MSKRPPEDHHRASNEHVSERARVESASRHRIGRRTTALLLAAGLIASAPAFASGIDLHTTSRCRYDITAIDRGGHEVMQAISFSLDRPGLLVAPLSSFRDTRTRWETLRVDPGGAPPASPSGAAIDVTRVLDVDPARNLLVFLVNGVQACALGEAGDGGGGGAAPSDTGEVDTVLRGLRQPLGYTPVTFEATLERRITLSGGPDLMLLQLPDGRGAQAGIVLDRRGRLLASILPPPAGADPGLAVAAVVDGARLVQSENGSQVGPYDRISGTSHSEPGAEDALRTFASALVLTRPEQIDRAESLFATTAKAWGESAELLLERGVLRFRAGRIDAAIRDLARASELAPSSFLALYDLGTALGTTGRYDEAAEAFRSALRVEDRARARYELALALQAAHRAVEARQEWELISRSDPDLAKDLRSLLGF